MPRVGCTCSITPVGFDRSFATAGFPARPVAVPDVGRVAFPAPRLPDSISILGRSCGLRHPAITDALDVAVAGLGLRLPILIRLAYAAAGTIAPDVGVKFVRLPRMAGNVTPEGLGFPAALLGFLPQPRRVHLGLLGVGTRPDGFGFPFAGVEFHIFSLMADLCRFLAVLLVALLLHRLPAPSAGEEQQHNHRHYDDGDHYPYPWSCVHVSHHFPLRCDREAGAIPAGIFPRTVITQLARVLTFH